MFWIAVCVCLESVFLFKLVSISNYSLFDFWIKPFSINRWIKPFSNNWQICLNRIKVKTYRCFFRQLTLLELGFLLIHYSVNSAGFYTVTQRWRIKWSFENYSAPQVKKRRDVGQPCSRCAEPIFCSLRLKKIHPSFCVRCSCRSSGYLLDSRIAPKKCNSCTLRDWISWPTADMVNTLMQLFRQKNAKCIFQWIKSASHFWTRRGNCVVDLTATLLLINHLIR